MTIVCIKKLNHIEDEYRTIKCAEITVAMILKNCVVTFDLLSDMLSLLEMTDPNCAWNLFRNVLSVNLSRHAPVIKKRVKGCFCPWLTAEVMTQTNVKRSNV